MVGDIEIVAVGERGLRLLAGFSGRRCKRLVIRSISHGGAYESYGGLRRLSELA